ncbi:serine protease inhibitor Kazal-type 4 isoform X2 [Rattus norvegicus]|uniref:serine protease inhibitor Kazal-type 4 isoform X2 n=1 Tax=Rattus norvegicus TaxID=10116 RepID=UPI002FD7B53C
MIPRNWDGKSTWARGKRKSRSPAATSRKSPRRGTALLKPWKFHINQLLGVLAKFPGRAPASWPFPSILVAVNCRCPQRGLFSPECPSVSTWPSFQTVPGHLT